MEEIIKYLYHVGDSGCSVFLVDTGKEGGLVLIDAGMSMNMILEIEDDGFKIEDITYCFLTHNHIDHIAACNDLLKLVPKVKFVAHALDAVPIENAGYDSQTAAAWYGIKYEPIELYLRIRDNIEEFPIGKYNFNCIHTPGHTPGSISIHVKMRNKGVLFAQDLHGPLMKSFNSNPQDYQRSLKILFDINADILCEGHFGIFQPASKAREYIRSYMK